MPQGKARVKILDSSGSSLQRNTSAQQKSSISRIAFVPKISEYVGGSSWKKSQSKVTLLTFLGTQIFWQKFREGCKNLQKVT